MAKKIKWAVLGSAGIARRRTIPEGIIPSVNGELAFVYDVNLEANLDVAKQFNAKAVDSMEELLKEDFDAVYIATPANLHHEHVLAFAKAKKHILCEKPLGMDIKESKEMLRACEDASVILGTAFMIRFHSQHLEALEMVQQGKLGKLVYGRAQLSCWYPPIENAWRQDPATGGGGSLMDMGGHCIDLLEMYMGKIKKVSCFINNTVHDYKAEDSAVATLFFESGAIGTVDNFCCIPDNSSKNILELYGSKGSILARNTVNQSDRGQMVAYLESDDAGYDAQQQQRGESEGIVIAPEPVNTYRGEVEEFANAVIEGRQPSNSAELGLQSQIILAACYESARTGRTVDID